MENKMAVFSNSFKLKSRAVKSLVSGYGHFLGGFYTRELREKNKLYGYELVSLSGRTERLAGKDFVSAECFNKYAVNKKAVEEFAVEEIRAAAEKNRVLLVDELGPIFLRSEVFRNALLEALASEKGAVFFSRSSVEVGSTLLKLDDMRVLKLEETGYSASMRELEEWVYSKIKGQRGKKEGI